ncbi:hypothetical protein HNQ50_002466 [Silvimonas terrae]|uniref:Uncharacterized protein n=1 Tax=Silvimonas terrae TaxID=300266 RepID=A0A840RHD6_9NEIS|nr:hypothetical protein [Silvimonas terrae]MBB5191736.1 hypothetical protein [Silvimonas terrae]
MMTIFPVAMGFSTFSPTLLNKRISPAQRMFFRARLFAQGAESANAVDFIPPIADQTTHMKPV